MRAASTSPQRTRSSIVNFLWAGISLAGRVAQKIQQRLVELFRAFEVGNMSRFSQPDETRTRHTLVHLLTIGNRRNRVLRADNNQCWNSDLRQQRRLTLAFRHSA